MAARGRPPAAPPLPAEVREGLAELELELSEGDITRKGYEKKRAKLLAPHAARIQGPDGWCPGPPPAAAAPREQEPGPASPASSRRERFRSDVHSEAVQAALARCTGRKAPMPSKRRSALVPAAAGADTPPDTSSASEEEGSLRPPAAPGSSTSSSASSTASPPGGRPGAAPAGPAAQLGVPVSTRVSSKIQQLLDTLRRPRRRPLGEFFVDDSEELLQAPQPDPNQPKPQGSQMAVLQGEPLAPGPPGPPSVLAALRHWGTTQPAAPCLTALDPAGKAAHTLTYGKLWSRSARLAYTLLGGLAGRSEPPLSPGDRVALVVPNSDPAMFAVAFYGCLLAELVPVPVEVPLTRKGGPRWPGWWSTGSIWPSPPRTGARRPRTRGPARPTSSTRPARRAARWA